jgi:hypothetical protein
MMKFKAHVILLAGLIVFAAVARAQDQPISAAESADRLRLQLIDVQREEENLRLRKQQLEEDIKPDNIARSLAGVGSTRPEELRESRRRQLQIELDSVVAQLRVVESTKARLEEAIRTAEAQAYHESAGVAPTKMLVAQSLLGRRWLVSGGAGFVVAGLLAGFFIRRRLRRSR